MERRIRTFPIRWVKIEPTPSNPSGMKMFYAHEWEAYQRSLPSHQRDDDFAEDAASPADALAASPSESILSSASTISGEGYGVPNEARGTSSDEGYGVPSEARGDPSLPPDFNRHARRCRVCAHPDRDAIEGEFIRWRSPKNIAKNYKIADYSSIHRHAHATGLFARRRREFARVLEDILECVEDASLENTADVIIRAARVYAHLDENGNWVEPPRTHIVLTGPAPGQFAENPELEFSAVPAQRPQDIPFKLASRLTDQSGPDKERAHQPSESLIAAHPTSENGPNS